MSLRLPLFGLLSKKSPMEGLVEHYDKISECINIINESLECYVTGGSCREMEELAEGIAEVEREADAIKRRIRNHLPRQLFMAVEKVLFLNYTNKQDNILDSAEDALEWLAMRRLAVPHAFQKDLVNLLDGVDRAATLLGPALKATIDLVEGRSIDREGTKDTYRQVRNVRAEVREMVKSLTRKIYNSDMDFKDIYQLVHFVDCLGEMSHNCSSCVDGLRAMIAR
ncbi:DUF47 domain-containing protein [Paucidesulfovibrio longus]|jgi:predicted phosphate transport protein (TIGR00153 family)|uniref:DUF47 domain-containing protein n=1 Tax=Paucidesulfovibrio longus TaxID=889 RepID=UPI0003B54457|nr:DUF47 family protein [Paucidesulfovibrio longus]